VHPIADMPAPRLALLMLMLMLNFAEAVAKAGIFKPPLTGWK
jgi:hypothetical protein